MKNKFSHIDSYNGITLIALIITIIVLVILAAVSISVAYKSRVVDYAMNGASDYTQESFRENRLMEGTESLIESAVDNINGILGGSTTEDKPVQPGEPEEPKDETNIAPVIGEIELSKDLSESTGNCIMVKTSATDEDDKLDYTLKVWKKENEEVDENELIKGAATKEATEKDIGPGAVATLQIDGLEEYTEYLYRVEVSDKKITTEGQIGKVRTFCSGKR